MQFIIEKQIIFKATGVNYVQCLKLETMTDNNETIDINKISWRKCHWDKICWCGRFAKFLQFQIKNMFENNTNLRRINYMLGSLGS